MDITISDYVEDSALADSTDNRFFFNSGVGLVRAEGVSQRLTLPILSSHFNQEVDALFKREMDKGVASPILVGAIPFDMNQPAQLIVPTVFDQVEPIKKMAPSFIDDDFYHNVLKHSFVPNHAAFLNVIEDALVAFKEGSLKKIVLSKILELELDKVIDSKRLLANMMVQNPNAYHFSVPLGNRVLVGASPELLLRKTGNRIYSNPLAGSAKRLEDREADRGSAEALLNSDKDQYEHRLVVDAIRSSLLEYVEELQIPDSPSLISTPTMWHLSTEIEATLPANNTPSIFDLIRSLHPTPAMCGTPTLLAQNQIEKFEPHDRGYFSGLVGWSDAQGNGEWAIAIRCAETSGNKVKLFAGAGVVPDSKPESEWLETSAKMRTMMNALGIKESIL